MILIKAVKQEAEFKISRLVSNNVYEITKLISEWKEASNNVRD